MHSRALLRVPRAEDPHCGNRCGSWQHNFGRPGIVGMTLTRGVVRETIDPGKRMSAAEADVRSRAQFRGQTEGVAATMGAVEFAYDLSGTGWARARVADDGSAAELGASYLSDALGDLLEAVGVLLEGARQARCSWHHEPGEFRWVFEQNDDATHVRVLRFLDQMDHEPDEQGTVVFETTRSLSVVAAAIVAGADAVLARYGEAQYLRRWVQHPFPAAHLAMVKDRLAGT
jgi:hypothetical protein